MVAISSICACLICWARAIASAFTPSAYSVLAIAIAPWGCSIIIVRNIWSNSAPEAFMGLSMSSPLIIPSIDPAMSIRLMSSGTGVPQAVSQPTSSRSPGSCTGVGELGHLHCLAVVRNHVSREGYVFVLEVSRCIAARRWGRGGRAHAQHAVRRLVVSAASGERHRLLWALRTSALTLRHREILERDHAGWDPSTPADRASVGSPPSRRAHERAAAPGPGRR